MGAKKGKRSANKKKCKLLNREKENQIQPPAIVTHPTETSSVLESDGDNHKGVLYRRYKAATEAVKRWALATHDNDAVDAIRKDHDNVPLSSIIAILHTMADSNGKQYHTRSNSNNTIIPSKILSQLGTAIRLRRKVSHLYQRLAQNAGSTTKQDYDGHAWIIDQLQAVYERFRAMAKEKIPEQQVEADRFIDEASVSGFVALSLDDDDDVHDDEEEDEESVVEQKAVAVVPKTKADRQADRELEIKEERSFAIACAWIEIEQARDHIRDLWEEWSTNLNLMPDNTVDKGELLGITCACRYHTELVRILVAQTSLEFDVPEDEFMRVVAAKAATPLQEGSTVSWNTHRCGNVVSGRAKTDGHVLVQPEGLETLVSVPIKDVAIHDDNILNAIAHFCMDRKAKVSWKTHQFGTVANVGTGTNRESHVLVRPYESETMVFCVPTSHLAIHDDDLLALMAHACQDHKAPVSWNTHQYGTVVSMKAKNEGRVLVQPDGSESPMDMSTMDLVVHDDNLLTALAQVYRELKAFDFRSVPPKDDATYIKENFKVTNGDYTAVIHHDMVDAGTRLKNRAAFVSIALKKFLPLWVAYSTFGGGFCEIDSLFRGYLREFCETRNVTLHLCFSLVALLDSCLVCMKRNLDTDPTASTISLASSRTMLFTLAGVRPDKETLKQSCAIIRKVAEKEKSYAVAETIIHRAHFIAYCTCLVWTQPTVHFPWLAGEYMMLGLGTNFNASSYLTLALWSVLVSHVHVYSMLRRKGFIGRIVALEESLIRMYRKTVWFKSGIPQKRGQYLSSWKTATGCSTEAVLHEKTRLQRQTRGFRKTSSLDNIAVGMRAVEMSNLMKIIMFQSSPNSMDKNQSSADIKAVAQHECEVLLFQPMLKTALLVHTLHETMKQRLLQKVIECFAKEFSKQRNEFPPELRVFYWVLGLADGREPEDTMQEGLAQVAQLYAEAFSDPSCLLPENKSAFTELEFNQYGSKN